MSDVSLEYWSNLIKNLFIIIIISSFFFFLFYYYYFVPVVKIPILFFCLSLSSFFLSFIKAF